MNSFYMDNCVESMWNEELDLFIKVVTTMTQGMFELREWELTNLADEPKPDTNVLGILWNKKVDTLDISLAILKELCFKTVTKKIIQSIGFSIQLVQPTLYNFWKLFLQTLWRWTGKN